MLRSTDPTASDAASIRKGVGVLESALKLLPDHIHLQRHIRLRASPGGGKPSVRPQSHVLRITAGIRRPWCPRGFLTTRPSTARPSFPGIETRRETLRNLGPRDPGGQPRGPTPGQEHPENRDPPGPGPPNPREPRDTSPFPTGAYRETRDPRGPTPRLVRVTLSDPGPGRKAPGPQAARADEPHSRTDRGRSGAILPCGKARRAAARTPTRRRPGGRPAGGRTAAGSGFGPQAHRDQRTSGSTAAPSTRRIDARLMYARNHRGPADRILTHARSAATPSTAGRPASRQRAHASSDGHVK